MVWQTLMIPLLLEAGKYVSITAFGFRFWITVFDVKTAVKAVKAMKSKQ